MTFLMALALGFLLLLTPLPRAWSQGMPPLATVCGEEPSGAAMAHWVDWDKCRKSYDSAVQEQLWKELQERLRQQQERQQLQEQQARERWLQEQERQRLLELEERRARALEEAAQAQRDAAQAQRDAARAQEEISKGINRPLNCRIRRGIMSDQMICD